MNKSDTTISLDNQAGIISLSTRGYSPDTKIVVRASGIYTTVRDFDRLGLNVIWKTLSPETQKIINGG